MSVLRVTDNMTGNSEERDFASSSGQEEGFHGGVWGGCLEG